MATKAELTAQLRRLVAGKLVATIEVEEYRARCAYCGNRISTSGTGHTADCPIVASRRLLGIPEEGE